MKNVSCHHLSPAMSAPRIDRDGAGGDALFSTDPPLQKKGAQAQKQVALIKSQASQAKTPEQKKAAAEKDAREKEKAASEKAKREMAELFKPIQVQRVPFGVDPKTVVCIFYKQGNCEKGKRCKFSHDLSVERKGEKINLYQDTREKEDEAKRKDDMADWDEGGCIRWELFYTCMGSVVANGRNREIAAGRPQQARKPENHNRQSLQVLRRCCREWQVRLALGVPERRRQVHVQAQLTSWVRSYTPYPSMPCSSPGVALLL